MADMLQLENVSHRYGDLEVLHTVSLVLKAGETAALSGPSGSGKTTLLQIAGLLDTPSGGTVSIDGQHAKTDAERTHLRRHQLGFIYQFHHLLPEFSALENALMPLRIAGRTSRGHEAHAKALLAQVGLEQRIHHRPGELSGGERQRVAIVRALVHEPKLVLADEPTGNLDEMLAEDMFALFLQLAKDSGAAVLVATHNLALAGKLDAHYRLHLGQLETP